VQLSAMAVFGRSAVGMAIPMGMGMGIEIPSPRQPWFLGRCLGGGNVLGELVLHSHPG